MALRFVSLCLSVAMLLVFDTSAQTSKSLDRQYQEVEWVALMPKDDLDTLLDPPDYFADIADGSQEDSLEALTQQAQQDEKVRRYQDALTSTRVVQDWHNKAIKIPGFIVPLQADEQQHVTEFFIVPYFGACLHMPPPPPNQIIYAVLKKGVELKNLYDPFWFEGVLAIEINENEMGTAAYRLWIDSVVPYED
ncbi:hypothetical protein GCM10009092_10890 [Bowmanella denitrificans]|uniref:Lipoprotein n=1 Tax=Bowmanella denitrificans TaxID=366582 RepID=A0ABN0WWB5_9ALTE